MKYTVILTEKSDGGIHVSVPGLPDCTVEAQNRDEALDLAREAIAKIVSRSEMVQVEVPEQPKSGAIHHTTPWEWFGAFKGDPNWNLLFQIIEQQRDEAEDLAYWRP